MELYNAFVELFPSEITDAAFHNIVNLTELFSEECPNITDAYKKQKKN